MTKNPILLISWGDSYYLINVTNIKKSRVSMQLKIQSSIQCGEYLGLLITFFKVKYLYGFISGLRTHYTSPFLENERSEKSSLSNNLIWRGKEIFKNLSTVNKTKKLSMNKCANVTNSSKSTVYLLWWNHILSDEVMQGLQQGWLSLRSTCHALPCLEQSKMISSGVYKVIWSECIQHYQSCFISTVPRPN